MIQLLGDAELRGRLHSPFVLIMETDHVFSTLAFEHGHGDACLRRREAWA